MKAKTLAIDPRIKSELDSIKTSSFESYNSLLKRMISNYKNSNKIPQQEQPQEKDQEPNNQNNFQEQPEENFEEETQRQIKKRFDQDQDDSWRC